MVKETPWHYILKWQSSNPDKPQRIKGRMSPSSSKAEPMICSIQATSIEEVPVICEYPDVFPKELPRMPPNRDLEFIIDLIPGTTPIAKRPYRMAANELEELKKQL